METKLIKEIEIIVDIALEEDLSRGDLTTEALIPSDESGRGYLVAKCRDFSWTVYCPHGFSEG